MLEGAPAHERKKRFQQRESGCITCRIKLTLGRFGGREGSASASRSERSLRYRGRLSKADRGRNVNLPLMCHTTLWMYTGTSVDAKSTFSSNSTLLKL